MKRKIIVWGFVLLLGAALCGCGRSKQEESMQQSSGKEYVYRVTPAQLQGWAEGSYTSAIKAGDVMYAYGFEWGGENGENATVRFAAVNQDGSAGTEGEIPIGENAGMNSLACDREGFLYGIKVVYDNEGNEDGVYEDKYYFFKVNEKGEELFSIFLNDLPQVTEVREEDWFYVGSLMCFEDDIIIRIMDQYFVFDKEGNFRKILKGEEEKPLSDVNLIPLENGKLACLSYEEEGCYTGFVDPETGAVSQLEKLPGASYDYTAYAGIGYDLYLVNSYGVFGYNIGDDGMTKLMDYVDSDLGVYEIYNVLPVNEREFWGTYEDMELGRSCLGLFSKVDPADVKDRETITLACTGVNWDIRTNIVKFNKTNEKYRISIQDYYSLYSSDADYMAGINRLNADIVSGKVPDILILSNDMPVSSYVSKGLFEDLKPYIEQDPELDINDYMPNIIEAFSVDGKLHCLVPYYTISTLIAKTSDVGKERGWTIQDVNDLMASKPEGTQFLTYADRNTMLMQCMSLAGNQFIDWTGGKCNFESEGFVEMLEFLKQFPEQVDDGMYTDEYWENYDSMWRDGKVVAQIYSAGNFRDINYVAKGTFGEPVTMIGFPSSNEDGSAIVPGLEFAIASKSSHKEGAWEFLRYYLSDEYQESIRYGFPLSVKYLDIMAEKATRRPTYTNEEGEEVETDDYIYIDGMEVKLDPMTKEEADRFKEELYGFRQVYSYDENLIQIVQEETAAYFSGQKSAKDVSHIVQSRAQIYVNENR